MNRSRHTEIKAKIVAVSQQQMLGYARTITFGALGLLLSLLLLDAGRLVGP